MQICWDLQIPCFPFLMLDHSVVYKVEILARFIGSRKIYVYIYMYIYDEHSLWKEYVAEPFAPQYFHYVHM